MASLWNKPSMRDLPAQPPPQQDIDPIAAYVDSLPDERKRADGPGLDPSNPKDALNIQTMVKAITEGRLDPARVQKLIRRSPKVGAIYSQALAEGARYQQQQGAISDIYRKSFQPEQPGMVPLTPRDDEGNLNTVIEPQPARADYQGAITRLNALGPAGVEYANKLAEQQKQMKGEGGGLYGGVQYAYDPDTKRYVPYSFDEAQRKPVVLGAPSGLEATVPMTPQVVQGPAGPQVVQIPGRGVPGTTPTVTPTGVTPSRENDVQEYAKALEKARVPAILPSMKAIDQQIAQYQATGQFPGIGNLKNMRVAQFVKTKEGKFIASAVQNLFNEELRQASGAAVTEWEEQRKRIADALGIANSADDYIRVYRELIKPRIQNAVANLRSGYGDAADIYEGRSKLGLKEFIGQPAAPSSNANPNFTKDEIRREIERRRKAGQL